MLVSGLSYLEGNVCLHQLNCGYTDYFHEIPSYYLFQLALKKSKRVSLQTLAIDWSIKVVPHLI